jgi:Domain of unknown function (DUF1929)
MKLTNAPSAQAGTRRRLVRAITVGALVGAGLALGGVGRAAAAPEDVGQWSSVYDWPAVAIHLHLLHDGRILSWADDNIDPDYRGADFTETFVSVIPSGGAPSRHTQINNTKTNMFCAGHAFLPNGRLLVVGGHEGAQYYGAADLTIFDPATGTWARRDDAPMNAGRWYAGVLPVGNGEVLVLSGTMDPDKTLNELPQVWKTGAGGWRDLTTARLKLPYYPYLFLAPDGRVFYAGHQQRTRFLDTRGTGKWTLGPLHKYVGNNGRQYGSAVQYGHGKILFAGGDYSTPTATAEVIDLTASSPAWRYTSPMRHPRRHLNLTVLPDGQVLATGGNSQGFNSWSTAVLPAELWDPATGEWATMASMAVPRLYHSTAMLLPDGRVLSAGGGRPAASNGGRNNENAEIYSPPYLFKGPRPTIGSAPARVGYGASFTVGTPQASGIRDVVLIRSGSVTHTFNLNQYFRRLAFSRGSGALTVPVPSNRNHLPPGHYMLFILDGAGVPSVAKIVRVG